MSRKLLFALLLASAPVTMTANPEETTNTQSFEPFTGEVVGSKVRLRVEPSVESHVVKETRKGELFAVCSETPDYYGVRPPADTKGYLFRTFVLEGVVEGERVNVRLYPDIEAPIIGQLNTGDKIDATVSDVNKKWLVVDLPESGQFYLAKEYVHNKGPVELLAQIEKRHLEASYKLNSAFHFAQAEMQKPFEQIDFDSVDTKLNELAAEYSDLAEVTDQANEASSLLQEVYVQKKIAFLEGRTKRRSQPIQLSESQVERLAKLGIDFTAKKSEEKVVSDIAQATSDTLGLASAKNSQETTRKMLAWEPLEESMYHLAMAMGGELTKDEFYENQKLEAILLTGVVESYDKPVKNRPGDYLLRSGNRPVAFLYSTKVNLQEMIGQEVTVKAAPRPNNNFAFPAYFVLSSE